MKGHEAQERHITLAGCRVRLVRADGGGWEVSGRWTVTDLEALHDVFIGLDTWDAMLQKYGCHPREGAELPARVECFLTGYFSDELLAVQA